MTKRLSPDALAYFREQGARGGRKGAQTMTAAQRRARATKASLAAAEARTAKKLARGQQQLDEARAELATMTKAARTKKKHAKKAT